MAFFFLSCYICARVYLCVCMCVHTQIHTRKSHIHRNCRYLARLKAYVRNRAQPEGSMAEGYIAQECLTFCSRYFEGVETVFNRPQRNDDAILNEEMYLFNTGGQPKGQVEMVEIDELSLKQAHRYVLLHVDGIEFYRRLVDIAV